ncbi:hypothetical protein [Pseudomonas umsongensis]|uniref:Tyr recombinase domain-containing protein n=1 Tax=Pseudomonas umsongensis TaxID=198618 RepID=A0AAE7DGI4_9PSED|nr:hypothetical protein [Pseudomonas umsongensis]QJC81569.1 hypothetical protein HGP31_25935 [Pseudomonas umsongensis]
MRSVKYQGFSDNEFIGHSKAKVLSEYSVDKIQYFDKATVIKCQEALGHGSVYGIWRTGPELTGRNITPSLEAVNFRYEIQSKMGAYLQTPLFFELLDQSELWLARYALLLRIGPSSLRFVSGCLDITTISKTLRDHIARLIATAIKCKLVAETSPISLFLILTTDDVQKLKNNHRSISAELARMKKFHEMGLLSDIFCDASVETEFNPRGDKVEPQKERVREPWLPLPDWFMSEIGPKVLRLVKTIGPKIIDLGNELVQIAKDSDASLFPTLVQKFTANYFCEFKEREGADVLDYSLYVGPARINGKMTEYLSWGYWPPKDFVQFKAACAALQGAHLWLVMLAVAGRSQEILSIPRKCFVESSEGPLTINGKTYKLSKFFAGENRDWVVPPLIIDVLKQQTELADLCESLADQRGRESSHRDNPPLWIRLDARGKGGRVGDQLIDLNNALMYLCVRLGVTSKPEGVRVHSHRFRKTIARLAALAITESPRVLMQLFGHKDVGMTLSYILTDKTLQAEISQISREMRIMRCRDIVERVHDNLTTERSPFEKYGGYGGGAMPGVLSAVKARESLLLQSDKTWGVNTAYELGSLLSLNGEGYRLIRPGVICTKPLKDFMPCVCGSDCVNRIEDRTLRRDTAKVLEVLMGDGIRARSENNLLLLECIVGQISTEASRFPDIEKTLLDDPDYCALKLALEGGYE